MKRKITNQNLFGKNGGFKAVRKDPKLFERVEIKEVEGILDEYKKSRFLSPEINIDKIYDVVWQKDELDEVGTILGYVIVNTPFKEESQDKDYIFGYSKMGLEELKSMGYDTVRLAQFPKSQKVYVNETMFNNFADKLLPNRDKVDFFEEEKGFIGKRIDTFSKSATDDYYLTTKGLYVDRLRDQQTTIKKSISVLAKEVLRNKAIVYNLLNFNSNFENGLSDEEHWMLMAFLKFKKDYINGEQVSSKEIDEVLKVIRKYKVTDTAKMRDSSFQQKDETAVKEIIPDSLLDEFGAVVLNDRLISAYIESQFKDNDELTYHVDYAFINEDNQQIIVETKEESGKSRVKIPLQNKRLNKFKLNEKEALMLKIYLLSQNECEVNKLYFNSNIANLTKKFGEYESSEEAQRRFEKYCKRQEDKDK